MAITIQLIGGNFLNKGAELMLRTAAMEVRERLPEARLTLPMDCGTIEQRRALGADDVIWLHHHRVPGVRTLHNRLAAHWASSSGVDMELMPGRRPRHPGISPSYWIRTARAARSVHSVSADQVDAVLDLSGYTYGDPWSAENIQFRNGYFAEVRRHGGKIILLPQQLGPFERPAIRRAFRQLYDTVDLIFVRDPYSVRAAVEAVGDSRKIRACPDFTVRSLASGTPQPGLAGRSCIVPNMRMLDKTDTGTAAAFEPFLASAVEILAEAGTRPFFLIHDATGEDRKIADRLCAKQPGLEIITNSDPFVLKQIIGSAALLVGSRFHALVGALSQGVPIIAVGWSPKYRALLEEYGCPEFLTDPHISKVQLKCLIHSILTPRSRSVLLSALVEAEARRAGLVDLMWNEVLELVKEPRGAPTA